MSRRERRGRIARRTVAFIVGGLGVAIVAAACGLFPDLDPLSRGASDLDASPDAIRDVDASADAPQHDAGTPDARVPDGSASFCDLADAGYDLCVDFEDGVVPGAFDVQQKNGGTLVVGGVDGGSLAGVFTMPPAKSGNPGASMTAVISRHTTMQLELDVILEASAEGQFDFVYVGGPTLRIGLEIAADRVLQLDERVAFPDGGVGARVTRFPVTLAIGRHQLRLVATTAGASGTATLFVNGLQAGSPVTFGATQLTEADRIVVGESDIAAPSKPWVVAIDNLALRK